MYSEPLYEIDMYMRAVVEDLNVPCHVGKSILQFQWPLSKKLHSACLKGVCRLEAFAHFAELELF